jgi:hypothetical protein
MDPALMLGGCRMLQLWCSLLSVTVSLPTMAAPDDQCARLNLRDGRKLVGRIIEETNTSVTFEMWIGDFRSEVEYPRSQVEELTRVPCEEIQSKSDEAVVPTGSSTNGADPNAGTKQVEKTRYMLVPIQGRIGFDPGDPAPECVTSEGLKNALNRAKRDGIPYVVMYVDCEGGFVKEAEELAELMRAYEDSVRLIAVIRQSISAAMWVTFGAEHIFVVPGASSGAALAYTADRSTGTYEVDQKFLAATGAQLAAWAAHNGHSAALARAMVEPEAELWATPGPQGPTLSDRRESTESILINGPDTIVALTADEMVQYGVARRIQNLADIGVHVEAAGWEQWGRYGEREMFSVSNELAKGELKAKKEFESLKQRLERAVDGIGGMLTSAVAAARASEPGSASRYEYTWTAGGRYEFTAAARDQWKSDHHRAIKTWREVADLVGHVADLLKEAELALESRPHSEYWSVQRPHEERPGRSICLPSNCD